MPKQRLRQHRRHRIANLLQHTHTTEPMLKRERLKTCRLAMRKGACAAWVVVFAAVAGYGFGEAVGVVGAPAFVEEEALRIVIGGVAGQVVDCVGDCAVAEEQSGLRGAVGWWREGWEYLAGSSSADYRTDVR